MIFLSLVLRKQTRNFHLTPVARKNKHSQMENEEKDVENVMCLVPLSSPNINKTNQRYLTTAFVPWSGFSTTKI